MNIKANKKTVGPLSQAAQYYTYNPDFTQSSDSTQNSDIAENNANSANEPTAFVTGLTNSQLINDAISTPLLDRRTREEIEEHCYALYFDKKYDEALKGINSLLNDAPLQRDLLKLRIDINVALTNTAQVLSDLDIVLNEKLDDTEALNLRSSIYFDQGKFAEALKDIDLAFGLSREVQYHIYTDEVLECLMRKSNIFYQQNKHADALNVLNTILNYNNNYAPALTLQSMIPQASNASDVGYKRKFFNTIRDENQAQVKSSKHIAEEVSTKPAAEDEYISASDFLV